MTTALRLSGVTGGYGDTRVVFEIEAHVDRAEILGVLGRNGVGKTTLARLIQGGLRPSTGRIDLNGDLISSLPAHRRRRLGLGYMPQTSMVFDDLTVRENLSLGQNAGDPEQYFTLFPRLAERLDQPAGTMSGGERKILAFVRTMIEDTNMIVLDEPSEGVQPENIDRMTACLKERASGGAGILLFEQNLTFLQAVADRFLGLDNGRVILDRAADDVDRDDLGKILSI